MLSQRLVLLFGWILICCSEAGSTSAPCTENRTELCIESLDTFLALDRPKFVNEPELDRLCREAEYGQRCSSDFLRTSLCPKGQEELLVQLQIGRSQEISKMFCSISGYVTDPAFRRDYLRQSPCLAEHTTEMKDCYRLAKVVEDPELEVVKNSTDTPAEKHRAACCPLVQYMECSANVIGTNCGSEARSVVLKLLQAMAGKHLEVFCKGVDAGFPDSPAACLNGAARKDAVWLSAFLLFYLLLLAWASLL